MSLDVYLGRDSDDYLYSRNLTGNLGKMAREAGLYEYLWRPQTQGISQARDLIDPLAAGVMLLATQKARFQVFDAPNGWGKWEDLLLFCADYLQACREHPDAPVTVSI